MDRTPVDSTNLASVGYSTETATLEVEFRSGAIYQYSGVPLEVYEGLMQASSKGQYFNAQIRSAGYPFSRVQ